MLLTRCPGCRTTFRITQDALEAAEGQVRCGRCSTIFDARDELSEAPVVETPALPPVPAGREDDGRAGSGDTTFGSTDNHVDDPLDRTDEYYVPQSAFEALTPEGSEDDEAPSPAASSGYAEESLEIPGFSDESSVIAELRRKQSLADEAAEGLPDEPRPADRTNSELDATDADPADAIAPEQVDAVLGAIPDRPDELPLPPWAPRRSTRAPTPSRWWAVAAALAIVALAVQLLHHYRSEIAAHPVIGTWLADGYSQLGLEIVPNRDPGLYQIMDWVASAEPDEQIQSSLNITARIQNLAQNPQPFPHVRLELKDRWDAPVGSRVFQPHEYMDTDGIENIMQPGQTARAQLRVLDPGEDAYGFQLDVCVPAPQGGLRCTRDDIFR